jgi:hypothetical protein
MVQLELNALYVIREIKSNQVLSKFTMGGLAE